MDEIDKYLNDSWAGIILDAGIVIILLKLALNITAESFFNIAIFVLLTVLLVLLICRYVIIYKRAVRQKADRSDREEQDEKQSVDRITDKSVGNKTLMYYADKLSSFLFVSAVVILVVKPDLPVFVFYVIAGAVLLLSAVKIRRLSAKN